MCPCIGVYFLEYYIVTELYLFVGSPNALDITYRDGFLYISAFSHVEFPVKYFDVEVTDITGIPTALTGRHNATSMGTLHLRIISDPTPNVCLPARVTVSAINDIGTNTYTTTVPAGVGMCIITWMP